MARDLSPVFSVLIILGFILVRTLVVAGQPQVPCYFIFGDSLVDSGNNNGLNTTARANYPPYGIDFVPGVTGRFTNGRTIADVLMISSLHSPKHMVQPVHIQ
ncbi:Lipase, GDSL, partial [Cynara cardunculus var. scolymus]